VSSYRVNMGSAKPVWVRNFRDARSIVAEAMINFMARDPAARSS
jgi:hypothetical protein